MGVLDLALAGPLMPQIQPGPLADPMDFSGRYNTALSPQDEAAFQQWLRALSAKNGRDMSTDVYDYDLRGAFKAGAGQAENGHFTDQFKKPNHPTFSTDSQYSGMDGYVGGEWQKGKNGKWTFKASLTQLRFRSPDELRNYFQSREPDSMLVLP